MSCKYNYVRHTSSSTFSIIYTLYRYEKFNDLKKQNPYLKTLIATGGWTAGSKGFSDMVTDDVLRNKFVRTSVKYVRDYGFDGLDIDWEYPALKKGSRTSDKVNFIKLLKVLYI